MKRSRRWMPHTLGALFSALLLGCPAEDPDPLLAEAAAAEARVRGQPTPALVQLLEDESGAGSVSFTAAVELSRRGAEALPALLDGLRSDREPIRMGCASALGVMRDPRPAEAIPHLTALLSDPSGRVRGRAAWALGEIGLPDATAIAALTSAASASDPASTEAARHARESLEKIAGRRAKQNRD